MLDFKQDPEGELCAVQWSQPLQPVSTPSPSTCPPPPGERFLLPGVVLGPLRWDGGLHGPGGHSLTAAVVSAVPMLSLPCRIDVLFLLAGSAGTTQEGFQRAKAFVRRFAQASLNEDARARVGVARYSGELEVAVPVGEYLDVPGLVRSLDAIPFGGGATLTGRALRQAAERGFGSTRTGLDRPRRVVVLLTESPSEDEVAGPARHARARELLLLLGLGSEAVRAELEEITGSPEHVMVYADQQDLFNQIPALQEKLCSRPPPGETQVPVPRAAWAGPRAGVGSGGPSFCCYH